MTYALLQFCPCNSGFFAVKQILVIMAITAANFVAILMCTENPCQQIADFSRFDMLQTAAPPVARMTSVSIFSSENQVSKKISDLCSAKLPWTVSIAPFTSSCSIMTCPLYCNFAHGNLDF